MSFFATKSRIAAAKFINIGGNGTGNPEPDPDEDGDEGSYWFVTFNDSAEYPGYAAGAFGKISYDELNDNVYYCFASGNEIKFGSFNATDFTPNWSRINNYPDTPPVNVYQYLGGFKISDNYDIYFVGAKSNPPDDLPESSSGEAAVLSKFDLSGSSVWEKRDTVNEFPAEFGSFSNNSNYTDLSIDSDGNIFCVGGYRYSPSFLTSIYGMIFAKFSPSGSILYQQAYNFKIIGANNPRLTAMDNTDHFYMHFQEGETAPYTNIISRISTDGTIVWNRTINVSYVNRITISKASGKLAVIGGATTVTGNLGIMDNLGSILWSKTLPSIFYAGVAFDSSDNVYVAGSNYDPDRTRILKFDSSGSLLWDIIVEGTFYADSISIDSNDDLYISGSDYDGLKYGIIKIPNSGIFSGTYTADTNTITFSSGSFEPLSADITVSSYGSFSSGATYTVSADSVSHTTVSAPDSMQGIEIIVP